MGFAFEQQGGHAWSELNKTKWHNLTLDNRRARACHPRGPLYLLKPDGSALEYRVDAPSHYHHVCEWGMDYHFWMDVRPFLRDGVLPAGTHIEASTTARLVGPDVTGPLLKSARYLDLTEQERFYADLPAYEEPENTFAVSALDRLDAQTWTPTSEGCAWHRDGGYGPGSGCLSVRNHYSKTGSWQQTYVELITAPCPSFVHWAELTLRFDGRGTACFSNVRWEMVA